MRHDAARDLLRRYLRQRGELGEQELVLQGLTGASLRTLLGPAGAAVPRAEAAAAPPAAREASPAPAGRALAPPPRPAPAGTPSRGIGADAIALLPTLDRVRAVAEGCPRCRLSQTRQCVVFGEGDPAAEVLVVGEAPGAEEDRSGRPFVGRAGRLLDLLLLSAGFARERVFICNVLKCRPPGNRNPQPDEVEACRPYLLRQVELVQPRVIVALGNFAAQTLLGTEVAMGKLRASPADHRFRDIPVVPTYHPAALLRHPAWVRAVWEDLQRVRRVLAG